MCGRPQCADASLRLGDLSWDQDGSGIIEINGFIPRRLEFQIWNHRWLQKNPNWFHEHQVRFMGMLSLPAQTFNNIFSTPHLDNSYWNHVNLCAIYNLQTPATACQTQSRAYGIEMSLIGVSCVCLDIFRELREIFVEANILLIQFKWDRTKKKMSNVFCWHVSMLHIKGMVPLPGMCQV